MGRSSNSFSGMVGHAAETINEEKVTLPEKDLWVAVLCRAALDANIPKLIHFSSVHAFQQTPTDEPLDEHRPLVSNKNAPPYDKSKAEAQHVIYNACNKGLNAVILHPTGIIGPYDFKPSRMGKVLLDIMKMEKRS